MQVNPVRNFAAVSLVFGWCFSEVTSNFSGSVSTVRILAYKQLLAAQEFLDKIAAWKLRCRLSATAQIVDAKTPSLA